MWSNRKMSYYQKVCKMDGNCTLSDFFFRFEFFFEKYANTQKCFEHFVAKNAKFLSLCSHFRVNGVLQYFR